MGRRASSGLNTTAIIGIAAVVVVVLAGGAFVLRKGKKDGFSGQPYPVSEMFSSASSLRRNEYVVEGTVFRIDNRDSGTGVGLLVGSEEDAEAVYVIVPEEVATINIERNVNYAFKILVGDGGVNFATAIKKP